jgi:hypothetical protein
MWTAESFRGHRELYSGKCVVESVEYGGLIVSPRETSWTVIGEAVVGVKSLTRL